MAVADYEDTLAQDIARIRQVAEVGIIAERAKILQIVVGDFDRQESVLQESPAPGSKRLLIPRFGNGTDQATGAAITTTPVEILEKNEGRVGGTIVNYGANAAFLFLCNLGNLTGGQVHQRPTVWLGAGGGSWDFRLGNVLYGGTVCAASTTLTTTLTVAEF